MPIEVNYRRQAGWLFALSAAGYLAVLAYTVYLTEPLRFGLASHPSIYFQMLGVFCIPLIASVICAVLLLLRRERSARVNRIVLATGVVVCTGLLLKGWSFFIVPLASPTVVFAIRMYQKHV